MAAWSFCTSCPPLPAPGLEAGLYGWILAAGAGLAALVGGFAIGAITNLANPKAAVFTFAFCRQPVRRALDAVCGAVLLGLGVRVATEAH